MGNRANHTQIHMDTRDIHPKIPCNMLNVNECESLQIEWERSNDNVDNNIRRRRK